MLLSSRSVIALFQQTMRHRAVRSNRRTSRSVEWLESRFVLSTTPNDPRFAEQVALQNLGQTGGTVDADVDAPDGWDVTQSSARIVTALVDSGIDYAHPDLYLNVWINQGELPTALRSGLRDTDADALITLRDLNQSINSTFVSDRNHSGFIDAGDLLSDPRWANGVDEDGNGFTDDIIGWDFANNDNDPFDDNGHGTHVGGLLAAIGNNGVGIAGMNWSANVMVVKFLDERLHADTTQAVSALNYVTTARQRFLAHQAGAPDVRVSNNSWEIRTVTQSANSQLSNAIAQQLQSGMLVVAAAGNGVDDRPLNLDTDPSPSFPAAYTPPMGPQVTPIPDAVLSVAAADTSDRLVFNSNFGATSVDLAAPGLDVLSTEPGGLYGPRTGTSMASPLVAGAAALFWARYPEASAIEVKQAVLSGVDPVSALAGKVLSGGRLNLAQTLNFDSVAPRATLSSAPNILVRGGTTQDVTVRFTDNVAVNVSSLGASDLTITRADGVTFNTTVSVQSVSPNANGSPIDVVYRLIAPSGGWTNADNATYRVSLQGNEVADTVGNKAVGGVLGSFVINIPNPDDLRVTSTVDSIDSTLGDGRPEDSQGRATLRAAIQESNFSADANTIKLPAGTYALSLAGTGEDNAATGDLDIRQNLTIEGASTSTTIIDAAGLDRVFQVHAGVSLTLRNLTVRGGLTSDGLGGGGLLNAGFLTLDHVEVTNNTASTGGGGGVLNNVTTTSSNDTLTLLDSTLSFNTATGAEGGGLKNVKGKATILRSTLHNNTVGTSGGGLFVQANTVTVTNSTVTTNTAGTIGGGLHLNAGVLLLTNVTTTLNTADSTGGGLARTTGTARLVNTIVAGNSLIQSAPNVDVAGTISASGSGNNFIGIVGDAVGFDASRQDIIGTAAAPQNANLAPLANYGGPMPTHRPNVGSGVIDRGVAVSGLTIDQRGLARSTDGDNNGTSTPDIGAVEFVLFGSISGLAYHDFDQEGQRDPDEPTLSGWTIFLDTNNDGLLNNGERSTVTSSNGSYTFNTVAPGNYVIAEVLQSGWLQTQPAPASPTNGRYTITLAPGEDRSDFVFGNYALPGEIRGTVFLDLNGDTIRNVGEAPYPNLTVFLDANRNGLLDDGELSTATDTNGLYSFVDLPTGRSSHRIALVRPAGLQVNGEEIVDLSTLDGTIGFRLNGIDSGDQSGFSVSGAGDVNGDGFDDLLIGARFGDPNGVDGAGESYVVFGKANAFAADLDLGALDGTNGFRLDGIDIRDYSGTSVSSAGDVNGDGFGDVLIGAYGGDPNGDSDAGECYVVFGKANGFAAALNLATLDGTTGFRLDGIDEGDLSGRSVSSAGDVNGDGFDDLLIGALGADPGGHGNAGESYVVFGKSSGFVAALDLTTLDGTTGFRLNGVDADDISGRTVSSAGDVNGDGFDDILIGAYLGDPNGDDEAGESYVVFGKSSGFEAALDLAALDGTTGFRLDGIDKFDRSASSVSSVGDVNGDGFDDLLIGASSGDPNGNYVAGESYVVFGKSGGFAAALDLSTLDGTTGFRLDGIDEGDGSGRSVSSAGDVNGDGFDDLLIGAYGGDPNGNNAAGESYVMFGQLNGFAAALDLSTLDGTNGFRLDGIDPNDLSGFSVSSAGDVNDDGFDDLLIGAYHADPNGDSSAGASYLVFGGKAVAGFSVVLDGGEVRQSVNFGLQPQTGVIRGELFDDHNQNGIRDERELPVLGGQVFLDTNLNESRDAGEPLAVVDARGRYEFSGLNAFTSVAQPNRTYRVVEEVSVDRLEFVQTTPPRAEGTVDITPLVASSALRIGADVALDGQGGFLVTGADGAASGFNEQSVFRVSADGQSFAAFAVADHPQGVSSDGTFTYWVDQNADANRSAIFRQALSGGPVELVADSSLTAGTATEFVALSGLDVVPPSEAGGTPTLIAVDAVGGRITRLPARADVAANEVTNLGAARYGGYLETAHAQFIEADNGVVYVVDPGYIAPGPDRSLDQPPRVLSLPLSGGSYATLYEGRLPSLTAFETAVPASPPRGIAVFGNRLFVTGDRAIFELPTTGGTPTLLAADERFDQLGELTYFDDALYVIDNGNALDPQATIWKVDLLTNKTPSRSVHVDETSNSRAWDITLTPGMVAENVDFARYDPNAAVGASGEKSISGRLFQDLNGNGIADAGEVGLPGEIVYLDLNHSGTLDPTDRQTVTLSGDDPTTTDRIEQPGDYFFTGLEPGLYDVLPAEVGRGLSLSTVHEISLEARDLSLTNRAVPRAVVSGDLDRDGDNDAVLIDSGNGRVSVLSNSGDQTLVSQQSLTVSGVPYAAALGNFDSDALPDLAVSRLQFGHIALAKNLGNGQFQTVPDVVNAGSQILILSSPGGTDFGAPGKLISADFNNDGKADLAAIDVNGSFSRVFVWLRTGNTLTSSSFAAPQMLTLAGLPSDLVAADFNNDGAVDLAATDFDSDKVLVWLNRNGSGPGTGTFLSTPREITVSDGPVALAVGDFDNRTGLDIAVANKLAGTVTVWKNDGAANFSLLSTLAGTSAPTALAVADFDGRNGPDIAVTQGDGDSAQPLTLFFNSADPTEPFVHSIAYGAADLGGFFNATTNAAGFALAAVNLDRDADTDLIVVNSGAGTVSTLRNGPGRPAQTVRLTANGPSASNINFGTQTSYATSFDAGSGLFTITLMAASEVEVSGLAGFVELRVNGALDTELTISAAAVKSILIQGSAGADRVDLSGISTANGYSNATGVSVRILGNDGSDTLTGSSFADVFVPGLGDDVVVGGPGTDILEASADVSFTLSNTQLTGQGTDLLTSVEAARLTGGASANTINAATFTGSVTIDGGAGNDVITATSSAGATIIGGSGNDIITTGNGDDSVSGVAGTDRISTGAGRDIVFGGTGNDTIDGGPGNDVLNGQSDSDSIVGGDGDDRLVGDLGNDTLRGGLGNDTLKSDAGIDSVIGEDGNDSLIGGDGGDFLDGGLGIDVLRGEVGIDTLLGGAGNDTLIGGADADSLDGGDDNDDVRGDSGNDTVNGGNGNDQLVGFVGNDVFDGGAGTDFISETLDGDALVNGANFTSALLGSDTSSNVDRLHLSGDSGANKFDARQATLIVRLFGNGGNDTLLGGSRVDSLSGGDGDDVLSGGASNDVIDGGAGTDFVYEKSDANVTINGMQVISTTTGTETLVGIERIALVGGDGANIHDAALASLPVILIGGKGNDTLIGGNFNDVLIGGSKTANPQSPGGDGTDSLTGGTGTDTYDNDPLDTHPALEANETETTIAAIFSGLPTWLDQV